jgi:uncharacterized spore protein YtfJ
MEHVGRFMAVVRGKLAPAALKDAVVSKPLSAGEQHVLVLSEVSVALGAGGGTGTDAGRRSRDGGAAQGTGGGSGGGAKARPVAVLVVERGEARLEILGG